MSDLNTDILSLLEGKIDKEVFEELKKRLSFLSHELKRPLSSVILNAYTLKDGYLGKMTDDQLQLMELVVSDLNRMSQTIKALLDEPRTRY
ncbi:MAG TPA: histidine kinase dimerization/phospho-acceptor domain-containing protein [bacterium]|nr:histidine kinase dimerization/phospho-acceptor domain-containing protein [bacterium]HPS28690.1 histidine kinase dimerization/phospho-acceptor domain-containing protein [bacterium]